MPIIRVNKTENYSVVSNQPINDESLSWGARGVLIYLLSKPNDWEVRFQDLLNRGKAGRHKMRGYLSELEESGYLLRERTHNDDGTFTWVHTVFEQPSVKKPSVDEPSVDEPSVDDQPIYKELKKLNTEYTNVRKRTAGENKAKDKLLFKPVLENEPEEESSAPRELSRNEATSLLADVFCEATGLKVPPSISHAAFNKLWRTPLWEIYQLCENDIDVAAVAVKEVCSHMRNEDLTISRPLSIINIARDRIAQGKHLSHLDDVQTGEEGGLWL